MIMDIIYFGNCSIDEIILKDSKVKCFGGSALNSALISSLSKLNIAVVSVIGQDFDKSVFGNVLFFGEEKKCNSNCFEINEELGYCLLKSSEYLSLDNIPKIKM